MRQARWASWLGAVAVTLMWVNAQPVAADVTTDRAAAIVNYPLIEHWVDGGEQIDTAIQLSNSSNEPVRVHCFYENANSHCSNDGTVCEDSTDCTGGPGVGICEPGWNETDFIVRLTPWQPLGWLASDGRSSFPLDGRIRTGVGGSSNEGSRIPPVPEEPFIGVLKCIVIDDQGTPLDRNVLTGEATVTWQSDSPEIDIVKYNPVGIKAIEGAVNDDRVLTLGGPEPEYNGCPSVLILNHLFDLVEHPAVSGGEVETLLALTPCTQDLLRQIPASSVVQYLVFNEFEQRFSTSRIVDCYQWLPLSLIDTTQPERSIFSAGVAGTVAGQTRMTPIGSGLIGVALEDINNTYFDRGAAYNLHFSGQRSDADLITLP